MTCGAWRGWAAPVRDSRRERRRVLSGSRDALGHLAAPPPLSLRARCPGPLQADASRAPSCHLRPTVPPSPAPPLASQSRPLAPPRPTEPRSPGSPARFRHPDAPHPELPRSSEGRVSRCHVTGDGWLVPRFRRCDEASGLVLSLASLAPELVQSLSPALQLAKLSAEAPLGGRILRSAGPADPPPSRSRPFSLSRPLSLTRPPSPSRWQRWCPVSPGCCPAPGCRYLAIKQAPGCGW